MIVGCGDVGSAWYNLLKNEFVDVERFDPDKGLFPNYIEFDIIHICIPYTPKFLGNLDTILNLYASKYVIIESTVGLDAFKLLQIKPYTAGRVFIYSPVRGTHPNLLNGLKSFVKFISPIFMHQINDLKKLIENYYNKLDMKVDIVKDYRAAILGKLLSTTWYGMNIAFCNMVKEICDTEGIDFDESYNYWMLTDKIGISYNKEGDRAVAYKDIPRPKMVPGNIGGHCVMPNLKILSEKIPEFYEWMQKFSKY